MEYLGEKEFKYLGNDLDVIRNGVTIIHWVGSQNHEIRVNLPDGDVRQGVVEHDVMGLGAIDVVLEDSEILHHGGVEPCRAVVELLGQPGSEEAHGFINA